MKYDKLDKSKEEHLGQLEKLVTQLEKMNFADYIGYVHRPFYVFYINFLIGVARGVGLTVGASLVVAFLFQLVSAIIKMNIPFITEILQNIVRIVQSTPVIH